jgi:hypothetical protein
MKRFMDFLPSVLQLVGSIVLTCGAYLIYRPSAIVFAGTFLILFGMAMERRTK